MNSLIKTQKLDFPANHIFQLNGKYRTSFPAEYFLLIMLIHKNGYLKSLNEIEIYMRGLNITEERYQKIMSSILAIFGFDGFNINNMNYSFRERFLEHKKQNLYYSNDDGKIELIPNMLDIDKELYTWIEWLITSLPEEIFLPKLNLFKVDDSFFEWIQKTPKHEQLSLFALLDDMNVEWFEWFHSSKNHKEIELVIS